MLFRSLAELPTLKHHPSTFFNQPQQPKQFIMNSTHVKSLTDLIVLCGHALTNHKRKSTSPNSPSNLIAIIASPPISKTSARFIPCLNISDLFFDIPTHIAIKYFRRATIKHFIPIKLLLHYSPILQQNNCF